MRELAQRRRDCIEASIGHLPRANLGWRSFLLTIELLHEFGEARHARNRRVNNQRIHLRICTHNNFARLRKFRTRTTARINRHCGLREHLIERLRKISRSRNLEWEDSNLAIVSVALVRVVEIGNDCFDLGKQISVRRHDDRIRLWLRCNRHWARAAIFKRARCIGIRQRQREDGCIRGAKLQDANRRRDTRLHIDRLQQTRKQLMLGASRSDE